LSESNDIGGDAVPTLNQFLNVLLAHGLAAGYHRRLRQPLLLSRTEHPSSTVISLDDHDTQRVYRLVDFIKAQLIQPTVAYHKAGKVNSAGRLYLAIDSVHPDTKHAGRFTVPALADGAGGSVIG
jgi:hypothetical protein